ncbi:hypothetical protein ACJJTC_001573 [Scirpophaga incertulas]
MLYKAFGADKPSSDFLGHFDNDGAPKEDKNYFTLTQLFPYIIRDLQQERRPAIITRHSPVIINFNSDQPMSSLPPRTLAKPAKPPPTLLDSLTLPSSNPLFFAHTLPYYPTLLKLPIPILPPLLPKLPLLPILPPILPPLLPLVPPPLILRPLMKPISKPFLGNPLKPITVPILGKKTPLEKLLEKIRAGKLKRNLILHKLPPIF